MRETHSFDFGPKPDGESQSKENKFLPYLGAPRVTNFSRKKYVLGVDN